MIMANLSNLKVAVLATDGFEEAELTKPVKALKEAGATVHVISPKSGQIQGFQHHDKASMVNVDRPLNDVKPSDYDAVLLPGGGLNADALRVEPKAQSFLQQMQQNGKPFAFICHAPWTLVSANLVKGRTLRACHEISFTSLRV